MFHSFSRHTSQSSVNDVWKYTTKLLDVKPYNASTVFYINNSSKPLNTPSSTIRSESIYCSAKHSSFSISTPKLNIYIHISIKHEHKLPTKYMQIGCNVQNTVSNSWPLRASWTTSAIITHTHNKAFWKHVINGKREKQLNILSRGKL